MFREQQVPHFDKPWVQGALREWQEMRWKLWARNSVKGFPRNLDFIRRFWGTSERQVPLSELRFGKIICQQCGGWMGDRGKIRTVWGGRGLAGSEPLEEGQGRHASLKRKPQRWFWCTSLFLLPHYLVLSGCLYVCMPLFISLCFIFWGGPTFNRRSLT